MTRSPRRARRTAVVKVNPQQIAKFKELINKRLARCNQAPISLNSDLVDRTLQWAIQLLSESHASPRILYPGDHPFLVGHPMQPDQTGQEHVDSRNKYLDEWERPYRFPVRKGEGE